MNGLNHIEKTDARRLVEASAWRTYLTETDQESEAAFEAWLFAEKGNRQAWDRVGQAWNFIGEQATSPELLDLRRRALSQARAAGRERWLGRRRVGLFRKAAVAAGLVLLAAGGFLAFNLTGPDVYRTAGGERRVLTLYDGSRVQMDSLTELRVDYSKSARELKLIKGQARFDVAHDIERPFSVLAAGQKVVATGTAFNVDLLDRNLFVTLIEGRVVVLTHGSPAAARATVPSPEKNSNAATEARPGKAQSVKAIELEVGEQLAISANGARTVALPNVQRATAWQSGQLVFENEPLSAVVIRVNRYTATPVKLMDEETASLRISGVFNTGDVDGFVSTVTHYFPIRVEHSGDMIHLSAKSLETDGLGRIQ